MAATITTFNRRELKYIVPVEKMKEFMGEMLPYFNRDAYPEYTIRNLYFDTDNFDVIINSIKKPRYKEKLRIRTYDETLDDSVSFLELKKKYNKIVYKRRIKLKLAQSLDFKNVLDYCKEGKPLHNQIAKEIKNFIDTYNAYPRAYLSYYRYAFSGKENSGLRLTLDTKIRGRFVDVKLEHSDKDIAILGDDVVLMEIKANDALPLFLAHALCKYEIYPTSFSKYGTLYAKGIIGRDI